MSDPLTPPSWPRAIRYRASQRLRHFVAGLMFLLSHERAFSLARRLARMKYRMVRGRYRRSAEEVRTRLGVTAEEADRILERYFELSVSDHLDTSRHLGMTAETIGDFLEVQGLDHLRHALAGGKGAVLYSGHVFGHYTFFLALALLGFPVNMVGFVEQQDRWMSRRWRAFFDRTYRMLWMKGDAFGIAVHAVNALRENGIVTVEIDHTTARRTVEVDFLAGRASFPTGPVTIAQASGAPMLHFWVNRHDGRWTPQTATIGPPFYVGDDVAAAVAHCAGRLESEIRADPSSWLPWLFPTTLLWADADEAPAEVETRRRSVG